MGRLEGKIALVTGGARGMGASHVRRFVDEGAKVVVGDVLDDDGRELVAQLGDAARFVRLDVTSYPQWETAVGVAVTAFGGLDILVNNAGIVTFGTIDEYSLEAWDQIIAINLTGPFYGIRAASGPLKASGRGSIINVSSTAGLVGYPGIPGYTASKFGVRGLTKSAALDLGRFNIRVNSVHPGVIRTPMTDGREGPTHVALGRIGEPSELSDAVVFLASDESSFATGAEFTFDGGEMAGRSSAP